MKWLRTVLALVALALGAWACNSPTIPIPPLHAPSFSMPAMDSWVAMGTGATAGAEVFVINRATGDGVSARADAAGTYATSPFTGHSGDVIEMFYRTPQGDLAPSVCAMLSVGTPPVASCP